MLVIELMTAMPAAAVKLAILEVAMVPHSSAAQIVVFQGCQGTASIWWVDKAGDLRFVRRASWHRRRFIPINAFEDSVPVSSSQRSLPEYLVGLKVGTSLGGIL